MRPSLGKLAFVHDGFRFPWGISGMNSAHIMAAVGGSLDTAPRLFYQRHMELGRLLAGGEGLTEPELRAAGRVAGLLTGISPDAADQDVARWSLRLLKSAIVRQGTPPSDELIAGIRKLIEFGLSSMDEAVEMAARVLDNGQHARVLHQVADQFIRPKAG